MAKDIDIPDSPNLHIFKDLSRTDPGATKPFQREGGFRGTQIDPIWRTMRLTEYFGPAGHGWGGEQVDWTISHDCAFVCMKLWYRHPETQEICWTPPQWGGSKIVQSRANGAPFVSDEALKMAATDAMGKCAAMFLGLSADIYLGKFEDSKYRDENAAYHEAKADPSLSRGALDAFETDVARGLVGIDTLEALDQLWKGSVAARLKQIQKLDKGRYQRILASFQQKKHQIQSGTREAAE